jgi:hypothetical protein
VEGKLAALTASELAELQVEVQLMMIDQEMEAVERRILSGVEVDVAAHDPQVVSENKFTDPSVDTRTVEEITTSTAKKGKKK